MFQLEWLFNLLPPLIQDQSDQPVCYIMWPHDATFSLTSYVPDHEDLCEEQWLVVNFVNLLKAEVTDQQYMVGIVSVVFTVQWSFTAKKDLGLIKI